MAKHDFSVAVGFSPQPDDDTFADGTGGSIDLAAITIRVE